MKNNNLDKHSSNNFSTYNTSSLYDIENDIFIPISSDENDTTPSPITLGLFINPEGYKTLAQEDIINFLESSYSDLSNFSDVFIREAGKATDDDLGQVKEARECYVNGEIPELAEIPETAGGADSPDTPDTPDTPDIPNPLNLSSLDIDSLSDIFKNGELQSTVNNLVMDIVGNILEEMGIFSPKNPIAVGEPNPNTGKPKPPPVVNGNETPPPPPPPLEEDKPIITPTPTQTTTPSSTQQPAGSLNVKDFGVKGDGTVDDQVALQNAINAAKQQGKPLFVPEGTYNHSGTLTLDGVKLVGAGEGTVFKATNPDESAIRLTGNGSSVSHIKTEVLAPNRSSLPNAAGILVQGATGATVENVVVQGASSNGIRLDGAKNSTIQSNLVLGTNADGIAVMNGSTDNKIEKNIVYQAGDDSFSDNSYNGDALQDSGNVFNGNMSLNNAFGRGMAFAGSRNATATNNVIVGSKWYGIYAATDVNSGTMQSSNHKIENNTFINNNNGDFVHADGPNMNVGNNNAGTDIPDIASILGWTPETGLADRTSFNNIYVPGTGPGSNNTVGNRT